MLPLDTCYDLCRAYVCDFDADFDEPTLSRILGWIRGRRLEDLAKAGSLFDVHKHDVNVFRHLRQVEAFFKKNASFSDPAVTERAAVNTFVECEDQCKLTNQWVDVFWNDYGDLLLAGTTGILASKDDLSEREFKLLNQIASMETYIRTILGGVDDFVGQLPDLIRVTPGATSTLPRRYSQPFMKVNKRTVATVGAKPYLETLSKFFGYGNLQVSLVQSNRVELVPKSWKTDRTIACEPTGCIPLQLAVDTYVKDRLKGANPKIDLRNQGRNQNLAKIGSITQRYATIDLKSASDTVAKKIVYLLFPMEWVNFLDAIRCTHYKGKTGEGRYEKFSSMGNGSTFVIETLIFAAACHATKSKDYAVYGDDIAIETSRSEELVELLDNLGFTVNAEKSFTTGPFRESCGSDWYEGEYVTPFYVRNFNSLTTSLCHLVNGLVSRAKPYGSLMDKCFDLAIEHKLPLVPFNGDSVSGVWVDPHTAYSLGLIRNNPHTKDPWVPNYQALVPKDRKKVCVDSRTLFLWHLQKRHQKKAEMNSRGSPDFDRVTPHSTFPDRKELDKLFSITVCSGISALRVKYSRKWVGWYPPAMGTPGHVVTWSDYFLRQQPD